MTTRPSTRYLHLASVVLFVALVLVTYAPGLKIGFYLDDYVYLERAGKTDWSTALVQIFDPRLQTLWYRPLQAIQFFLEYNLFGGNSNVYHWVNMGLHVANVLLLFGLAARVSRRWWVGFASAFFYATFSVYASGVNWVGIVDPLTAVFYLLSVRFWWIYLETERRTAYALAFAAFVLALLCKQISVTLPVVLFLVETWLRGRPFSFGPAARRYALFVAGAILFMLVQAGTESTHTFAGVFGWQVGATMLFILIQYLVLFFFPWGVYPSIDINQVEAGTPVMYAWAAVALAVMGYVIWRTRSRGLLFLGVFTLLTLIPVLPFPFIEHRYLYLPILSAAVMLALLLNAVRPRMARWRGAIPAACAGLALLAFGNGLAINGSALSAAEWARQLRVPFRDIERQHASFPADTRLYFIDPITPTTGGLAGMFLLRYGREVSVGDWTEYAGLRDHAAAYVYYFDETGRPREILVQKESVTRASLTLPARTASPITLEGYEVAQSVVRRGDPLVVVLYWRAGAPITEDYSLSAHLVDAEGRSLAGVDGPPRKGRNPTTSWVPTLLQVETVLIPIGPEVPTGSGYRVEIGLYRRADMARLSFVGEGDKAPTDVMAIQPFTVVE